MKTYHETTGEEILSPDLNLGNTYFGRKFVAHHEEVKEVKERKLLPGTEKLNRGKGLYTMAVVTPHQAAYDEYEDCWYYHPYTDEELAAMNPSVPEETTSPQMSVWDEMAAAFKEGVNES